MLRWQIIKSFITHPLAGLPDNQVSPVLILFFSEALTFTANYIKQIT